MTDQEDVKRLIRENPWATFVSNTTTGLVASHYPALLEEGKGITILTHFGKPDDELHETGGNEMLIIIQGPHDYVSPSWYPPGEVIPTWNHVTAHLYGVPEVLEEEENYGVLTRLTDHFEQHFDGGRSLAENEDYTRRVARGTVGLRIPITRFDARAKLSQNKKPQVVENVIRSIESRNPRLASEMRRVHPTD